MHFPFLQRHPLRIRSPSPEREKSGPQNMKPGVPSLSDERSEIFSFAGRSLAAISICGLGRIQEILFISHFSVEGEIPDSVKSISLSEKWEEKKNPIFSG